MQNIFPSNTTLLFWEVLHFTLIEEDLISKLRHLAIYRNTPDFEDYKEKEKRHADSSLIMFALITS